jgi:hypothetical protein
MSKTKLTLCTIFMLLGLVSTAQSVTNVLNLKSTRNSGEIYENQKLVGYYVFYFKEKADKKTSAYEVSIMDDNYTKKKSFEIIRPKNTQLLEMVYNGSCFLLYFYDRKTGVELITYDKAGKILGTEKTSIKDLSAFEIQRITAGISAQSDNVTLYATGNSGFVRQSYTKNKKMGYELVAYDNSLKKLWSVESDPNSKLLEGLEISEVTENYVTATVIRKKSALTKKMDGAMLIVDIQSGKKICETELGNETSGKRSLLKSKYLPEDESFLIVGEYYKPGDDILKDKSQGIYIQKLNEGGKELSLKEFSWKVDIAKYKQENLDEEDLKDANKPFYIFFHNVIIGKNGHIYLVGEQFKKQISAGAVAGKLAVAALGGTSNVSSFEIRVGSMVLIELNEKVELVDFKLINKKKTSVFLPEGAGMWSTAFLGYYINATGGFDYRFTSKNVESDTYSIIYTDYNKKKEGEDKKEKVDCMLGVISINAGKIELNRVPIKTDASVWWVNNAKPGNVGIGEYYRKEKKIVYRLEPLSF